MIRVILLGRSLYRGMITLGLRDSRSHALRRGRAGRSALAGPLLNIWADLVHGRPWITFVDNRGSFRGVDQ